MVEIQWKNWLISFSFFDFCCIWIWDPLFTMNIFAYFTIIPVLKTTELPETEVRVDCERKAYKKR